MRKKIEGEKIKLFCDFLLYDCGEKQKEREQKSGGT